MSTHPKSAHDHWLEGTTPQGKALVDSKYAGGRPRVPRHLSPAARAEYKRACQFLEQRGTLTPGDYGQLTVYAEVFARWLKAKAAVGDDLMVDVVATDSNGVAHTTRRLNPLLKVCEACETRFLALSKSLGLTPRDRDHVKKAAPAEPKVDELIPGSVAWVEREEARERAMQVVPFVDPKAMTADDEPEPEPTPGEDDETENGN